MGLHVKVPDRHRRFGQLLVHWLVERFIHFNPILHQFDESFADSRLLVDPGQYLLGLGDIRNHEIEEAVLDITYPTRYEELIKLRNDSLIEIGFGSRIGVEHDEIGYYRAVQCLWIPARDNE